MAWPPARFLEAYQAACVVTAAESARIGREPQMENRLWAALARLDVGSGDVIRSGLFLADRLGRHIISELELVEGAEEAVARLSGHFRLVVVSNYSHAPVVENSLRWFGLAEHFAAVLVSADVGWLKPAAEMFEAAFAAAGAAPEEILFVGDDLTNDIEGARAHGCNTAWVRQPGIASDTVSADIQLAGMVDLPGHLGLR